MASMSRVFGLSCALALIAPLAAIERIAAEPMNDVAKFYRGKTVNAVVGYGPGSTFELYLRILTRHRSDPQAGDDKPLDPEAARLVSRVRLMMAISALTTLIAVLAVLGVVSYRLLRSDGSTSGVADMTAMLPKGARIIATAVAEDRIAVTVDVNGTIEIRTFDLRSLKQTGRLRFVTEP